MDTGRAAVRADTAPTPRPVAPDEYGKFEELEDAELSRDGARLAYGVDRVDGEDELRIRPLDRADPGDSVVAVAYGSQPTFSDDGRWLAYSIGVSEEERERLREGDEPVHISLGLMDLTRGDTAVVDDVREFAFGGSGRYLAFLRHPEEDEEGGDDGSSGGPEAAGLVVRDLEAGRDVHFGDVVEFAWQREGNLLAMAVHPSGKGTERGVQLYDAGRGVIRPLDGTPGRYRDLEWRTTEDDLAALRAQADTAGRWEDTTQAVVAWTGLASDWPRSFSFGTEAEAGLPDSLRVVTHRGLRWAEDGSRLFFGVRERDAVGESPESFAARPHVAGKAVSVTGPAEDGGSGEETSSEPDTAGVLVWHGDDVDVQSRQRVEASEDLRESDLAAWHLESGGFVHLGKGFTEEVELLRGDRLAVGVDAEPYGRERMFGPRYADVYLVEVDTGERRPVVDKVQQRYFYGASPGGRYLLWLKDDHYHAHVVGTGETSVLTSGVPASFVDLDDDHTVAQKPPFGRAGWIDGDGALLAYSEHDVWRLAPAGGEAENLTRAAERSERGDTLRYRHVDLTREEAWEPDFIDPDAPLYLHVYDERREMYGYAVLRPGAKAPERLVWKEAEVSRLEKAEDADRYLFRIGDFEDSPDLFAAGPGLDDARQVTHTNPFLADRAWGRSDLLEFENARGERLQGALFYPAKYDPDKEYPLVVYIYEIRSPSVRWFQVPSPEDPYSTAAFTSEGYFVFQPDIVYRNRNPGLSAVEAIVPAVKRVLATGMVDSARVGLVGHSWGGYQTAFTVTQTDIFRAAVAGAPLTNLVSMYHSIYWRTGGTDARIFEISQGRMEVPPWEDMESYVANSPLHHVTFMDTPLLMAFGTDDGAVEFNQGVEFYNAARRAGKPLVMLTYEGEDHGISRRDTNARDYRDRVMAWFDHHLKGDPAPDWVTEGVPYLLQQEWKEERLEVGREKEDQGGGGEGAGKGGETGESSPM